MEIDGLGAPQQPDPKSKKLKSAERSDKSKENQKTVPDSIELAKDKKPTSAPGYAQDIQKGVPSEKKTEKDLSQVRQRTTNGYYDKPETKEKTSDKLIRSDELKEVVDQYHLSNLTKDILSKTPDIRYDKVAGAKKRMAERFYNSSANFGAFADKIIKHFGV